MFVVFAGGRLRYGATFLFANRVASWAIIEAIDLLPHFVLQAWRYIAILRALANRVLPPLLPNIPQPLSPISSDSRHSPLSLTNLSLAHCAHIRATSRARLAPDSLSCRFIP